MRYIYAYFLQFAATYLPLIACVYNAFHHDWQMLMDASKRTSEVNGLLVREAQRIRRAH